jgi:hypothetical protein
MFCGVLRILRILLKSRTYESGRSKTDRHDATKLTRKQGIKRSSLRSKVLSAARPLSARFFSA